MRKGLLLTTVFVLMSGSALAEDEELPTSGTCGTDCTWSYDESTKTIKITGNETGTGVMEDYTYTSYIENTNYRYIISAPWAGYRDIAENVTIEGISNIGKKAFLDFGNIKHIEMDDNITSLGGDSFGNLYHLETIKLSDNLTSLGGQVFQFDGQYNSTGLVQSLVLPDSLEIVKDGLVRLRVDTLIMPANLEIDTGLLTGNYDNPGKVQINHMYCPGAQMQNCSDALKEAGVDIEPTRYEKTKDGVVVYDNKGHIVGKYQNTQAIGDGKVDAIYKYSDSGHFMGTFDAKGNRIGKKIYTVEEAMEATAHGDKFHVYLTYK